MKQLLENDFVISQGKKVGKYKVDQVSMQGNIALVDAVACSNCINFFKIQCQHETFKVFCSTPLNVLFLDEFMQSLGLKEEKCDFLLHDSNKIVLADSTCSLEQYLGYHFIEGIPTQGKRLKTRSQIASSINQLFQVQTISDRINQFLTKEAILAYRVKDEDLFRNVPLKLERSEHVWLIFASQNERRKLKTPMPHNFVFSMVRYPNVYKW